jgi:hypothetical protein
MKNATRWRLVSLAALVVLAAGLTLARSQSNPSDPPSNAAPSPPASETPQDAPQPAAPGPAPKAPDVKSRRGFSIAITNPVMNDFRYGRSEIEAEVKASDPTATEKAASRRPRPAAARPSPRC